METRKEKRHDVEIQGRYRSGIGMAKDVKVTDLSVHGCRVFDRFSNLQVGHQISIRIGSIGPLNAMVKWRERTVVGLRFLVPLHPSVLEHMRHTLDA
jgi:hypothetical protein